MEESQENNRGRPSKTAYIVIGPTGNDWEDVVREICEQSEIRPQNVVQGPDNTFSVVTLGDFSDRGKLLRASGSMVKEIPRIVSSANIDAIPLLVQQVPALFPDCIKEGGILNLSRLAQREIALAPAFIDNLSFTLFYSALKCQAEGINVTKLCFEDNGLRNTMIFSQIKSFFPHLTEIYLKGNPIPDPARCQTFFERSDIIGHFEDSLLEAENPGLVDEYWPETIHPAETLGGFETPISLVWSGLSPSELPYAYMTNPEMTDRAHIFTLDDFPPLELIEDDFILNSFFSCFFKSLWNLQSSDSSPNSDSDDPFVIDIKDFYAPSAVFSITACPCGPYSALCQFQPFSSDVAREMSNAVDGPENIEMALKQLFPLGFFAHPTALNYEMIGESMCAAVFHGVFQSADEILMFFDRSLLIDIKEDSCAILNDHVYIHKIRPVFYPNPQEAKE